MRGRWTVVGLPRWRRRLSHSMTPDQEFRVCPVPKVLAFGVRFIGWAGWRRTVMRVVRCGSAADDGGVGIPVYHIRARGTCISCSRATEDEALPGGRQRGHSSAYHHAGTLRSTLRPASFMHHYAGDSDWFPSWWQKNERKIVFDVSGVDIIAKDISRYSFPTSLFFPLILSLPRFTSDF